MLFILKYPGDGLGVRGVRDVSIYGTAYRTLLEFAGQVEGLCQSCATLGHAGATVLRLSRDQYAPPQANKSLVWAHLGASSAPSRGTLCDFLEATYAFPLAHIQ